jgi:neurofibromin 1
MYVKDPSTDGVQAADPQTLALYSPNTYTRRRCRRIAADIAAVASGHPRNVVAACSPQELQELMPVPSLLLPEYTMQLAYEAVRTYQNFVLVTDHDMHVGVLVKVGETSLQIRPVSPPSHRVRLCNRLS